MRKKESSQPISAILIKPQTEEELRIYQDSLAKAMINIAIKQFGEKKVGIAISRLEAQQVKEA